MYLPIEQMPDHSRVWVYQANRPFSASEIQAIENYLTPALTQWAAHGAGLNASFEIRFHQVIVIAVDETVNAASGCSIDASTRWFKEMGSALGIDFFDRSTAIVEGDEVTLLPLTALKNNPLLTPSKDVIPLQTESLGAYRSGWLQRADSTWLKRYFA
ncbi:MAG: hypothetical protein RLZZ209_1132 [Bacteroidota bacterium]|jgi:hypothetical protein